MEEIFKIIEETPNYSISNFGNIYNNKTKKFLKLQTNKGYKQIFLFNKRNYKRKVQRLSIYGVHFK